MMKTATFETTLLPDGHLACPKQFAGQNARFRVIVTFEDEEATQGEIELAAAEDVAQDFLSEAELAYYLDLDEP